MKSEKKKKDYKAIENDPEAFKKFKLNFIKQALRRASYRWPYKHLERSECRVERGLYQCKICKNLYGPKEMNSDHKDPVESIKTGFTTLDNYADRLFVPTSGWQSICLSCHAGKTLVENELRRANGQKPLRTVKKKKK